MTATIVTIGDELLIGQVIDTNSAFIAQELGKIGISIKRRVAVGDDENEIMAVLNIARTISELIIITGGLGPTKDDITKHTLCKYFGSKLIVNEEIKLMVIDMFRKINRPMPDVNLLQAELPDNCIPIKNYYGTAPGMCFVADGKMFVAMPGVPFEMKPMFVDSVIPMIRNKFKTPFIVHRTIHTQGIGESALAEKIADIEDSFPKNFKLAYLPHYSIVRLRISATGENENELKEKVEALGKKILERIGEYVFGFDDTSLEKVIGEILRSKQKTIGTAESCTGGLVAHKLVTVAGSSDYFKGSIVSYSYDAKENLLGVKHAILETYGAVSEETVREMALGALQNLKTDYAIAISGIAGPGGGTPDKPVGTVWIAVANSEKIIAKKFSFTRSREIIMEYTAITAMGMVWRMLNEKLN